MYVTSYFNVCHPARLLQQTSSSKPFWMRKGSVSTTQIQLTRDVYVNVQFKDLGNLDNLNGRVQECNLVLSAPILGGFLNLSQCNSQLDRNSETWHVLNSLKGRSSICQV